MDEQNGVYREVILGYRIMRLDQGLLYSPYRGPYVWEAGVNSAYCLDLLSQGIIGKILGRHGWREGAPAHNCMCGLYAHYHLETVLAQQDSLVNLNQENTLLCAVVGWGRVELHRDGFRAQHMRLVGMATRRDGGDCLELEKLAARYAVRLVSLNQLPVLASEHGVSFQEYPSEYRDFPALIPKKKLSASLNFALSFVAVCAWVIIVALLLSATVDSITYAYLLSILSMVVIPLSVLFLPSAHHRLRRNKRIKAWRDSREP
jgi:hypothetical protein